MPKYCASGNSKRVVPFSLSLSSADDNRGKGHSHTPFFPVAAGVSGSLLFLKRIEKQTSSGTFARFSFEKVMGDGSLLFPPLFSPFPPESVWRSCASLGFPFPPSLGRARGVFPSSFPVFPARVSGLSCFLFFFFYFRARDKDPSLLSRFLSPRAAFCGWWGSVFFYPFPLSGGTLK